MVHGFMTQSGGDVRIESEPGVGTSVKLYFRAEAVGRVADRKQEEEAVAARYPGARILIAEDQENVLAVLKRSLQAMGHDVIAAPTGDQAAEVFLGAGPFDLLITDIVMPGKMQGPDLAVHLRTLDPDLPVVFLSGYASDESFRQSGIGDDDIRLMKPVARRKLVEAVDDALSSRRT